MIRWTIRILAVFVVLILAAAVIVHFVLRSVWLHDLLLARVSEKTGMEVTAESLSIGWGGETTIRDAVVKMPLTGEVLLSANRIALVHEVIPLLILGRPINVRSVEVNEPELNLRRYDSGRWNVQDVWDRLRTSFGSAGRQKNPNSLPRVAITNAEVRITEPNGFSKVIGPLSFEGRSQGALVWLFDFEWPRTTEMEGQLVPGRDWAHEVGFSVEDIAPLIQRFTGEDLSPIRVAGRWEGRVAQGGVSGTMQLERFTVGPVTAHGGLSVEAQSGQVTVRPRNLVFDEPNLAGQAVRLTDGSVQITGRQIAVSQLAAVSELIAARVSGGWDLDAQVGEFSGSWIAVPDANSSQYSGTYQASVRSPPTGRKAARVSLTADVNTPYGRLNGATAIEGGGADWRESQWLISLPTFNWSRENRQVDLAGATAEIRLAWPEIRLVSMHLPNTAATRADVQFNAGTRQWSAHLASDDMGQLKPWGFEHVDVRLNAEGDEREARVSELRVAQAGQVVTVSGELSLHGQGFQDIRLTADWPAGAAAPEPGQAKRPIGHWRLEGDVFGRIQPLAIDITGRMTGQDISLGRETVSRVEVPVRAKANRQFVQVATDPVELLGGRWQLSGQHEFSSDLTQVSVTADKLALGSVAAMVGLPLNSHGQAHAEVQVAMKGFSLESAVADGSWIAQDVNIPPFQAQRGQGKLHVAGGLVQFSDILLEQQGGQARGSAEFRLDDPQVVSVDVTSTKWPARVEGYPGVVYVDAKAGLRVNLLRRTAEGKVRLSGDVLLRDEDLARLRVVAAVEEQTVNVQEFDAETLGGSIKGQAVIRLADWRTSTGELGWKGIQPKRLETWAPQFDRFGGTTSGTLRVVQVPEKDRPPEPMLFEMDADIEDGHFGPAQVNACRVEGYFGETRFLLDKVRLNVLEGQLNARARISKHAGQYYGNVAADFNDLDLNEFVHVFDPNVAEHIGRLSGTVMLLGSSRLNSFSGEAQINLSRSDLVNSSIVGVLYNTLNLQLGKQKPTGTGEISVRLEGGSVIIPSASYFNRGVEIRGAGRIVNVNRGAESPVEGFAVASTRVLKGIRLPGIRSLDRLMDTFQSGAASTKIEGTLGHPEVKVVPLPVVLGSFRNLLWAQLGE